MLVMLTIGMIRYLIFQFYPMTKVYWAFTNIGQVAPSKVSFIGFANFARLFGTA